MDKMNKMNKMDIMNKMNKINNNGIFMALIGVLGLFLSSMSLTIDNKLKNKPCNSIKLKNSIQAVGILGLTGIVASISYFICIMRCNNCNEVSNENSQLAIYGYLSFVLMIGIVIIVLGFIIQAESKDSCEDAAKYAASIWVTGVLLVLLSGGYLGFNVYTKYKNKSSNASSFSFDNEDLQSSM